MCPPTSATCHDVPLSMAFNSEGVQLSVLLGLAPGVCCNEGFHMSGTKYHMFDPVE